jgi:hypothetical protein
MSKDSPITTSGMTKGAAIAPTNNDFPRNLLNLVITIAAIVPIITDTVAERTAIFRLVSVARKIIGSDTNALYHFKENPDQTLTNRDSLNE